MSARRSAAGAVLVRAALVWVALVCAGAPAVFASPGASLTTPRADPTAEARTKATALRLEVDRLRVEAEQATESYDAAYDALGRVVSAHLSAQRALDSAQTAVGANDRTAGRRVRALYMAGGAPALYATVLQGQSISDVLTRLRAVRTVVALDRTAAAGARQALRARTAAEQQLAQLAERQTRLQAAVAERGDQVRALLARTDELLAAADARVRVLAEQQRQAQQAAAARRAAAELSRAAATAGLPGLVDVPAPSAAAAAAVAAARGRLGTPYLWGATGPDAFDCSGLTLTAYRQAGVALPRTSRQQWLAGPHVELGALAPGDLLFWATDAENPGTIHHVAIYIGGGLMIAAPHAGAVVRVQPVYLDGYIGAVRPAEADPVAATPQDPVSPVTTHAQGRASG